MLKDAQPHVAMSYYVTFQMAGILTIWELALTTFQFHVYINKVKGQGCLTL